MFKYLTALLWATATGSVHGKVLCKAWDPVELRTAIQQRATWAGGVFFASWCAQCPKTLENLTGERIYIAYYDELEKSQRALDSISELQGLCVWDQDHTLSKALNIKGIPAQVSIDAMIKAMNGVSKTR